LPTWRRTFAALRHRDFAVPMMSALVHMLAMQMGTVAFGYLAYELTGSATALGLIGLAWGLPMLTLSLVGGVVADRFPRRTILMLTQGTIGVSALIAFGLMATGQLELWHLFAVALLQGCAFAFNMPTRQAFIADVVGREDLANAVALNNANMNLMRVLGPALAGLLIASPQIGAAGVFGLMAACYVFVVATIFRIRGGRVRTGTAKGTGVEQLLEGLRYIRATPSLILLLALGVVPMLLGMHYQMLMPVFALGLLEAGPEGLGLLSMAAGIGALAGSVALAASGNFPGKARVQVLLGVAFGVGLLAFALAPSLPLAMAALVVVGASSASYQALNNTLVMEATPPAFYGRVMSVYMMIWSLQPLATMPTARLADLIGAQPTVAGSGVLLALVVAFVAFGRKGAARAMPAG
jgi:MFS family permease